MGEVGGSWGSIGSRRCFRHDATPPPYFLIRSQPSYDPLPFFDNPSHPIVPFPLASFPLPDCTPPLILFPPSNPFKSKLPSPS